MKIDTQMGRYMEKTNMPISVNQVKKPGMISRVRWSFLSRGSVVLGLGKLNPPTKDLSSLAGWLIFLFFGEGVNIFNN